MASDFVSEHGAGLAYGLLLNEKGLDVKKPILISLTLIIAVVLISISRLFLTSRRSNLEAGWYQYEPVVVQLSGKIIRKNVCGPPNYGENPKTDQKVEIFVLVLDEPINVKSDSTSKVNGDSFKDISEIQLLHKMPLTKHENKLVHLNGTLFEGISGHHYTTVLMNVMEVGNL